MAGSDAAFASERLHVAILGGRTLLRQSLKAYLEHAGLAAVASADTADGANHAPSPGAVSVAVLLVEADAFVTLRAIRETLERLGKCPLVVVSNEVRRGTVHSALRLGAAGFVCGDSDPAELVRAIQIVAGGKVHLDPTVAHLLVQEFNGAGGAQAAPDEASLSRREIEIVQLLCDGLSAKEVARRLHLSTKTVENHKYHVYRKCGVESATGLFRYAVHHSLVAI